VLESDNPNTETELVIALKMGDSVAFDKLFAQYGNRLFYFAKGYLKSKAYDDVENFPNKFTAEYLFLINVSESSLPRITESSRKRLEELTSQWETLSATAKEIIEADIPGYNKQLWEAGIGAVRKRK